MDDDVANIRTHDTIVDELWELLYATGEEPNLKWREFKEVYLECIEAISTIEIRNNWNKSIEQRLLGILRDGNEVDALIQERIWLLMEFLLKYNFFECFDQKELGDFCLNTWQLKTSPSTSVIYSMLNIISMFALNAPEMIQNEHLCIFEVLHKIAPYYPKRTLRVWILVLSYVYHDGCLFCEVDVETIWSIEKYASSFDRYLLLDYANIVHILYNAQFELAEYLDDMTFIPNLLLLKRCDIKSIYFEIVCMDVNYALRYPMLMACDCKNDALYGDMYCYHYYGPDIDCAELFQVFCESIGENFNDFMEATFIKNVDSYLSMNDYLCDQTDRAPIDFRMKHVPQIYQLIS